MKRPFVPDDDDIVQGLLNAYRMGAFPMSDSRTGMIGFYTADPRGILPLHEHEGFHVPRSVEKVIRSGRFEIRADSAFEEVMRRCALPRCPGDEAWISDELVSWYTALSRHGHAHSIEAWRRDPVNDRPTLVGGIYGVSLGSAFFGESMFCEPRRRLPDGHRDPLDGTDASKVCLVMLVRHLAACGYTLFDTQMVTEHVRRFGGQEVSRAEFETRLDAVSDDPDRWIPFPHPALGYDPRPTHSPKAT
ncbi:MAG: leucyl/phenylalanyl-tRNA--protein transferase [Phycisphaeraceae bacterium]|nr:MAG: leucyl/phenylalanyl-tRNA--protein transferase [Phycisphaeraceae bacterium]